MTRKLRKPRLGAPERVLAAVTALLLLACSSPRGATPMPEPLSIDPNRFPNIVVANSDRFVEAISGDTGAAPSRALVRLTNLDSASDSLTTVADAQGRFYLDLGELVRTGDELRLQAVRDGERGPPLDLQTDPFVAPSERHGCVGVFPGSELVFTAARAELEFTNLCVSDVSIANARTRLGAAEFRGVAPELPLVLQPNESARVEVLLDLESGAELEEILFLDVTAEGRALRYPVTLYFPGAAP